MNYSMKKMAYTIILAIVIIVSLTGCIFNDDSHKPTASFSIEPFLPQSNELVFFNSTSIDTKYEIVTYEWYSNDVLIGDKKNVTYTFKQNGVYEIVLKVTNSQGIADADNFMLMIGQNNSVKQKLLGLWQWTGNNQIGNWTFYENNTLKSEFTGILPNGVYGSRSIMYWKYTVDDSYIHFTEPSDEHFDSATYSYELLLNNTLLKVTYENSTAEWYKAQ